MHLHLLQHLLLLLPSQLSNNLLKRKKTTFGWFFFVCMRTEEQISLGAAISWGQSTSLREWSDPKARPQEARVV
jgi:hypothetical protein